MGINAQFAIEMINISELKIDEIIDEMNRRMSSEILSETGKDRTVVSRDYPGIGNKYISPAGTWYLVVHTLERIFDSWGQVGHWPYIYSLGEWLSRNFGSLGKVMYGPDGGNPWDLADWNDSLKTELSDYFRENYPDWEPTGEMQYPREVLQRHGLA